MLLLLICFLIIAVDNIFGRIAEDNLANDRLQRADRIMGYASMAAIVVALLYFILR